MNTLEAAKIYIAHNWSVIPIKRKTKIPHVKWLEFKKRLPTIQEWEQWTENWADCNIGLILGDISGIFALDFDTEEALQHYKAVYDPDVMNTMIQKTPHGFHALFNVGDQTIPLIQPIFKGLDLKGAKSYIVVEPSIHPSGDCYKWGHLNPLTDGIDDILDPPPGFYTMLEDHEKEKEKKEKNTGSTTPLISGPKNPEGWEQEVLMGVAEGERDTAATKLAGLYLNKDYEQRDALTLLQDWNLRNNPPLNEKDIRKTINSIYGNHAKKVAQKISEVVEKITILRYPDGKNKYQLHLGYGRSTSLTMDDLMSSRRTTVKIADTTKAVFCPLKQKKWLTMVQSWLDVAKEKKISIEESELGIIKEILGQWLMQWNNQKDSKHINLASMVNNSCVVEKEVMYFTLTHLEEDLRFRNVKMTRTLLCEFLRRLGANVTEPRRRFDNSRIRTWDIKEENCE